MNSNSTISNDLPVDSKSMALPDPLYDKAHPTKGAGHYRPRDFDYDAKAGTCICPAGKRLYQNGANCRHNGHLAVRKPDTTPARQVSLFRGRAPGGQVSCAELMRRAIDSERGRALYGGRFATVEPVFGNLRYNKGLDRFTLRGQKKVDTQ